jgi:hypothetical protein
LFVQLEGLFSELCRLEGFGKIPHCFLSRAKPVTKLAFQIPFRAFGLDRFVLVHGTDAVGCVNGRHGSAADFDEEFLASFLCPCFLDLFRHWLIDAEPSAFALRGQSRDGLAERESFIAVEPKTLGNNTCP